MRDINTKKGRIDTNQLVVGLGFIVAGILVSSVFSAAAFLFIPVGTATIWTSYYNVYYCTKCGNNHGEYPYNYCKKCGNRKFTDKRPLGK